jgi:predicted ATP-grasp superfamily ATP-dependent carboligase
MLKATESMRLFVCEYLCGGWGGELVDSSLRAEGAAMLAAIANDFCRVDDCRVVTLWDERLGCCPIERAEVILVRQADEATRLFRRYAAECDATFDIAPELDGTLLERRRIVEAVGGNYLGASAVAIELCADKLRLADHLTAHGIPTIRTRLLSDELDVEMQSLPLVIKRRDGAGGRSMQLVRELSQWERARQSYIEKGWGERMIAQPFIEGQHLSVAAIVGEERETVDIFPVGQQRLSDDGEFRYLGGRIPAEPSVQRPVIDLVRKTLAVLDGLTGYVGFDILLPESTAAEPLVVEINPRLTTGYLGYRELADENLAERLLLPEQIRSPIRWYQGAVEFTADGSIRLTNKSNTSKQIEFSAIEEP